MAKKSYLVSIIIILISVNVVIYVKGSEPIDNLSFSLRRDLGISFGNYMQGTFTLTGEGSESIVKFTVFFNGQAVYTVSGNSFSWKFNTDDYQDGTIRILLKGEAIDGQEYQTSKSVEFLSSFTGIQITVIVLVAVALLIMIKYGRRINWRKDSKKTSDFDSK